MRMRGRSSTKYSQLPVSLPALHPVKLGDSAIVRMANWSEQTEAENVELKTLPGVDRPWFVAKFRLRCSSVAEGSAGTSE